MSFYNPNIQKAFDKDEYNFIKLTGLTFGTYKIIYRISDGFSVVNIYDLREKHQLNFVGFDNRIQEQNLTLVDKTFPALLADIVLEALIGKVTSLRDFIIRNQPFNSMIEQYKALYEGDRIQDFIELLVYSDIAAKHISKGERDFTKIFKRRKTANEFEYFTLFERLKLYDYLKIKMKLEIDKKKTEIKGREVILFLKISV